MSKPNHASEKDYENTVHTFPSIILKAIPEIESDGELTLTSLGCQVPANGNSIDNLFVDSNGVLTIVECKLFSNEELKREVYSQILHYASFLQNKFQTAPGNFKDLLLKHISPSDENDASGADLKNLASKNEEFWTALEHNTKNGIFRLVILIGPESENPTNQWGKLNTLIDVMNFAENKTNTYDLILMEMNPSTANSKNAFFARSSETPELALKILKYDDFYSRILWRRFFRLPELESKTKRKNELENKEQNDKTIACLKDKQKETFLQFINILKSNGLTTTHAVDQIMIKKGSTRLDTRIKLIPNENKWELWVTQISNKPQTTYERIFEKIKEHFKNSEEKNRFLYRKIRKHRQRELSCEI